MKEKKAKISLHTLFKNKKFTIVLSVISSVILWIFVTMNFGPVETRVITDVPVSLNLTDSVPTKLNLQPFGVTDYTVDVTVKGKRFEISQSALSADDLIATAVTSQVDSAGKHSLQVKVAPRSNNADFEITEYTEEYIQVYFDTFKESEYTLEADITGSEELVADGYVTGDIILSSDTVAISGPATEIDKISKVVARVNVDEPLSKTETFVAEVLPMNEYSGSLGYLTIDYGLNDISVTVPVFKTGTLPVGVTFKNVPSYYLANPLKITADPSSADIAMSEEALDAAEKFSVGTVDFTGLSPRNNKFVFKTADIIDAKVLDETESFEITVDLSGFDTVEGLSVSTDLMGDVITEDGKAVTVSTNTISGITVVGPTDNVQTITADNLTVKPDLSALDINSSSSQRIPVVIGISNSDNCWVYGTYYINVRIG